jgi:heme exporter protein B
VLGIFLNLDPAGYLALLAAMLLGTPTLTLIGAIGAALVLGARRGGVLISLLVLPLYIPVLIFGVSAVDAAIHDTGIRAHLMIMGAMFLGALALAPWAAAGALRQASE